MKYWLPFIVCLSILAEGVLGQKDDKKPEQWPVEVRLDLSVTDASKNPVHDLNAADIKIYENDVEQKVTYVVKRGVSNIAFVMDNSGSMRDELSLIKGLGNTIVDDLGDTDPAAVIRFVGNDKITIEQPSTTNKLLLKKAFARMSIEGGQTAVRDAIYLAAQALLKARNRDDERLAMILISDGEDRNSYYSEKDLFSFLRGTDVQVFVLGLTDNLDNEAGFIRKSAREKSESFLHTLTVRTGGTAYILGKGYKKEDLDAAITSLITEIHSPFVVGYTSTNQEHNGQARKLRVEIADGANGEKRTAVVKNSFTVPKY
jgi:Ca-activated chloride channel family protein